MITTHDDIFLSLSLSLFLSLYIYGCVYIYTASIHTCIYICIYMYTYIYIIYIYIYVCIYMHLHLYICIYIYISNGYATTRHRARKRENCEKCEKSNFIKNNQKPMFQPPKPIWLNPQWSIYWKNFDPRISSSFSIFSIDFHLFFH